MQLAPKRPVMMRTKYLLPLCFVALGHTTATAQKHVYEDLLVMYVDEKYEKCIFKAEGYATHDATKRDPLPFLYISMSLHEMAKQPEKYAKDYPKAGRDALKWAEKYRRKDKNLEFFRNYEDYWISLNTYALDEGELQLDDPKGTTRARQAFTSMTKYYPENPGPWLLLAVAQHKANMAREADTSIAGFEKAMAEAGDINTLSQDQKRALKSGLIRYSDLMLEKGQRDQARKYIAMGKDAFMDQDDFKGAYNALH
ncbi:MAG: hypothetical protein RBT71_07510 [Flavobacteriales bacterium]|jgi:hypothetical protein|nr:hypothetical protein [Flavobacteriales bacterium]